VSSDDSPKNRYIGAIVGESTCNEFRLAVAPDSVREQDIIAVDAELRQPDNTSQKIRVWAKVQRIERLNPLFPAEAGHELAATETDPFDTVLSLSREMVTAVCQVLGSESLEGNKAGKLDHLRYPPKPASSAYGPNADDIARIVLGALQTQENQKSALDIATLSNRPEVDVKIDGHTIVMRHLAILAMTGAGKSWTSRRIIEQLAEKNYPIVIFDPRGDYTGLADVEKLKGRVRRYYAQFPVFEQDPETVLTVVEALGWKLANTHSSLFEALFEGAKRFIQCDAAQLKQRANWLSCHLNNPQIAEYGLKPNFYFFADFVQALLKAAKEKEEDGTALDTLIEWCGQEKLKIDKKTAGYLDGLPMNLRTAAKSLREMEDVNKRVAASNEPLPTDRTELVRHGGVSVISLAGYAGNFQATICSLIAKAIFNARVTSKLKWPAFLVLEEAHNFVPASASTPAEERSIATIRQIAQEGRKFRVGLLLISQRPSRLDETTLSMCNSFIIMRMVNPADQNFVRRVMETLGEEEVRMLPDLDKGEAILSGQMINFPVLAKIKQPDSRGEREESNAFDALEEDFQASLKEARRQTH